MATPVTCNDTLIGKESAKAVTKKLHRSLVFFFLGGGRETDHLKFLLTSKYLEIFGRYFLRQVFNACGRSNQEQSKHFFKFAATLFPRDGMLLVTPRDAHSRKPPIQLELNKNSEVVKFPPKKNASCKVRQ